MTSVTKQTPLRGSRRFAGVLYGQPMTIKLNGKVEPYFEDAGQEDDGVASEG